jgi:choline dehydrogenase-like flavoprotein
MVTLMSGLDDGQRDVVRTLLPTILGLDEGDGNERIRIDAAVRRLSDFLASLDRPDVTKNAPKRLATLITLIDVYIQFKFQRAPGELSAGQRDDVVRDLFEPDDTVVGKLLVLVKKAFGDPAPTLLDIARSLREMFALAYYSDPRTDSVTGYTPIWERAEVRASAPEIAAPPLDMDVPAIVAKHREGIEIAADTLFANDGRPRVAVLGSGAGGAVMAAKLAATGRYDVAVFEAGPRFTPSQYPLDTMSAMSLLFEDGIQTLTQNLDIQLLRGRAVGGSTILTSGMTIKPRSSTLAEWHRAGLDQGAMNAAVTSVEKRLRIGPIENDLTCDPGERWRAGGEALAEDVLFDVPLALVATNAKQHQGNPRANPDRRGDRCLGCGLCNYGCHFGHKLSMDLTYLLDAEASGARVHANLGVKHLVSKLDPRTGDARVTGLVLYRDPYGVPVPVDHVVLAAGAVGSAALLLRSIEREAALAWLPCRDLVGMGLGFNYGATAVARWDDEPKKRGDAGLQISYVASKASDSRFVLESAFVPPALMSTLVPGVGAEHRQWMRNYRKLGMCVNTIGSPQTGEIDQHGNVQYRLSPAEIEVIHETLALIVRMYLSGGAAEVGISGVRGALDGRARFLAGEEKNPEKLLNKLRRVAPDADYLMLASAHPQGGMRMGKTAQEGVVAPDFRVHGVSNLFVSDASIFPSTIVVNPQWTVMALAEVAAGKVAEVIERG